MLYDYEDMQENIGKTRKNHSREQVYLARKREIRRKQRLIRQIDGAAYKLFSEQYHKGVLSYVVANSYPRIAVKRLLNGHQMIVKGDRYKPAKGVKKALKKKLRRIEDIPSGGAYRKLSNRARNSIANRYAIEYIGDEKLTKRA